MNLGCQHILLRLSLLIGGMLFIPMFFYNISFETAAPLGSEVNSHVLLLNPSTLVTDGEAHITGQLKNVGNKTLNYVKVLASFYDQNNKFLGTKFNHTDPTMISPNTISTFDISVGSSNLHGKAYTLTVAWQNLDGSSGFSIMKPKDKKHTIVSTNIPGNPILPQAGKNISKIIQSNHPSSQSNEKASSNPQVLRYPLKIAYLGTIGSEGSTSGKFFNPAGIEYSPTNERIYVADLNNNRIQIFDSNGHFITSLGTTGSGDGQFNHPGDVAIDSVTGYMYVSDIDNNRIQKFDTSGKFIEKWGSAGTGDGQFNHPGDIVIDTTKRYVYVTDVHNNRIQKFDTSGKFIEKWGSAGTGDGQLKFPTGIAMDGTGTIYVADTFNNRIQKFNSAGHYIAKWGSAETGPGKFDRPDGITFDNDTALLYVSDRKNSRVLVFTDKGDPFYQIDLVKLTKKLDIKPRDVAVDTAGKLFVVDKTNNKVHVFSTKSS